MFRLLLGMHAPGGGAVACIADQRCEGADEEDDLVPQFLELGEGLRIGTVAQVKVGLGGIEAQ